MKEGWTTSEKSGGCMDGVNGGVEVLTGIKDLTPRSCLTPTATLSMTKGTAYRHFTVSTTDVSVGKMEVPLETKR